MILHVWTIDFFVILELFYMYACQYMGVLTSCMCVYLYMKDGKKYINLYSV